MPAKKPSPQPKERNGRQARATQTVPRGEKFASRQLLQAKVVTFVGVGPGCVDQDDRRARDAVLHTDEQRKALEHMEELRRASEQLRGVQERAAAFAEKAVEASG